MPLTKKGKALLAHLKARRHEINNAEQIRIDRERREWLDAESFRVMKLCSELSDTMDATIEIFTGTNTDSRTEEDAVRIKMLSEELGIDLTDLKYKPATYAGQPGSPHRSYQITAAELMRRLEAAATK